MVIPAAAIPLIRECANEAIPIVCEDIERTEVEPLGLRAKAVALKDLLDRQKLSVPSPPLADWAGC